MKTTKQVLKEIETLKASVKRTLEIKYPSGVVKFKLIAPWCWMTFMHDHYIEIRKISMEAENEQWAINIDGDMVNEAHDSKEAMHLGICAASAMKVDKRKQQMYLEMIQFCR